MKFNWGTGLALGMVLFIAFIMTLVVVMSTDKKYAHELVTEDYYKKEMELQDNIYAEQNGHRNKMQISLTQTEKGIELHFPDHLGAKKIEGIVFLYRPSGEHLDFDIPIVVSNSKMLIPSNRLLDGRWNIDIKWSYEDTPYLQREKIIF